MNDTLVLLLTSLSSMAFSFIIVTLFDTDGLTDPSLSRDLNQLVLQMATILLSVVISPLKGISTLTLELLSISITRTKWILFFLLFSVLALTIHYYHSTILTILDESWTCAYVPLAKNLVTPTLQVFRLIYAVTVPLFNAFIVLHGQIFQGWSTVLLKCNHRRFFEATQEIAFVVKSFSESLASFFGFASTNTATGGSFLTNDFDLSLPINHTMTAISLMEDVIVCACSRFEVVIHLLFLVPNEPHLVAAIDNLVQTGVRIGQSLFRLLFGELPDIYLINFKYERFLLETALAFDSICFKGIESMLKVISSDFTIGSLPPEGPLTIVAHTGVGFWHAASTLLFNGPIHLFSIFDNEQQTSFDVEMWSMGKTLSQFHKSTYSLAVLLQWMTYMVQTFVTADDPMQLLSETSAPLSLSCDWARDVSEYRLVPIYESVGCSVYNAGIASSNAFFIGWGAFIELVIKTLFTNEQDMFRTLQRWEGPSIAREQVYTCEDRAAATAYNYTVPSAFDTTSNQYNNKGWIWTQDIGQCQCDIHYGVTLDENQPHYNPWCGQPSLNFDVFAPLDAFVMHVSHGILGPGLGDSLPFVEPQSGIGIDIEGPSGTIVNKYIQFPIILPPLTRTGIESMRVLTRVALSWGDIVTGHWFNYPVNCGHGLNGLQIQKKYESLRSTGPKWALLSENEQINSRWAHCGDKTYKSSGSTPLQICEKSNDKSDCMCSYLQPLTPTHKCRCISRYPDLDVTASNQEVGDLLDKRFTSPEVSMHWCNSMIIEWTFQNTGAFADALDYMVSLGPINPTCDVADRVADTVAGTGTFATSEQDQRAKKTYLIANTPTLAFTGEFMTAETKLNHIKDLYTNTGLGCQIIPSKVITLSSGQNITTKAEWSCDASERYKSVSISSLDSVDASSSNSETRPGCRIWGRYDFFCSAGLYVRNTKRLSMNIGRQFIHNGMSVLSGNFADINFNTLPRMCDYERQQGALAAMIAGIIPNMSIGLKKAFAKYINMILQVLYIQSTRTVMVLSKMATDIVMGFEKLDKEMMTKTFQSGVDTIVDGYLWAFGYFWETTGELLEEISSGSGQICASIVEILNMVRKEMKNGLMKLFGLVLEVSFQMVAAVTGNEEVIGPMFENLFKLWAKLQTLLIQKMWTILSMVFDFFTKNGEGKEGFGVILKMMASTVCELMNKVMGAIDKALSVFGVKLGWKDQTCLQMGNDGRRRLEEEMDITQKIAETLEWNGTSVCDHFMTEVARYKYDELRPLEKATWLECVELKFLGIELQSLLGSIKFPQDIFYNWKRKYMVVIDTLHAMKIVLEHYTMNKSHNWNQVRLVLLENGLDADLYIKGVQRIVFAGGQLLNTVQLTNLVETSLGYFDEDYKNNANPSEAAQVWQAYSSVKKVAQTTSHEWTIRDMSQQAYRATDAMTNVNVHLHNWWLKVGTAEASGTHTDRVFGHLKRSISRGWHVLGKANKRHHRKMKAPKITSIKTCQERGSEGVAPIWCTNCNIVDNAVEALIVQANGMKHFYTDVETGFPSIIQNVSGYFDELTKYNSEFLDQKFSKLSSPTVQIPRDEKRWSLHVAKDWNELFDVCGGVALNLFNQTWRGILSQQVEKILSATSAFVSVTNDTYVPFFGYSFFYMYDYILFSQCNLEESIFVSTTTQEARLDKIDTALVVCLVVVLIIVTSTTWSALPLVWLANTVVIGMLVHFLYLYIVYGYMLNCAPLTPYALVEDINAWYHTRLDPGCFYKSFPNMAKNASDDTCLSCAVADHWQQMNIDTNENIRLAQRNNDVNSSFYNQALRNVSVKIQQQYQDCAKYVPENRNSNSLTLPTLMEEYFIFWPLLFWGRMHLPQVSAFIIEYGLVEIDSVIGLLAMSSWQQEPIDPMWVDCYNIMWLDNVVAVVVIVFGGYVAFKMSVIMVDFVLKMFILSMYGYTSLGYISLMVEQSVVEKAKIM